MAPAAPLGKRIEGKNVQFIDLQLREKLKTCHSSRQFEVLKLTKLPIISRTAKHLK